MKRICLLGATIAAVLIIGVASALAATSHASKGGKKSKAPATVTTKVSCASSLNLQVPAGAQDVSPASLDGTEMGTTNCAPVGKGVELQSFTTEDSGDITGKWQSWFATGSVFGTFTMTPSDNNPPTTTTSFSQASYTGSFIVKDGTGAFAKAVGTGSMTCATQDSVHFTCKQKGKVTTPAPKTASRK
ncbi:MAG TPA: hypothetical protein VIY10_04120 [Solirubrobacteraceae bacterium]